MLAQLFILFALASVAISTKNLREAPAAANVVLLDHQRAGSVLKSMMKQRTATQKSDASFIRERAQAGTAKGRHEMQDKNAKLGADAKTQAKDTMSADARFVKNGYYITRHRPNSDCSGVPTMVYAQRLDNHCQVDNFAGDSYLMGCSQKGEDGPVSMVISYFSNQNCAGTPYFTYTYGSQDECAFNTYGSSYGSPPNMQTVQCSGKPDPALRSGGLVFYTYDYTNQCQSPPKSYSVQKFGACQLVYEFDNDYGSFNENTRYTYVTMDECTNGKVKAYVTMTGYSDPGCTRAQWRGTASMSHNGPDLTNCEWDNTYSEYTRTECRAPEV